MITMACHSYITDISTSEARTTLLGKLLSMNFIGIFLGSLLNGILLDVTDYMGTFLAVIFVNAAALVVVTTMLPETIVEQSGDLREKVLICKCEHIKESISVVVRRRSNWKRFYLWMLFVSIFIHQACKVGEVDITLLFVKRKPLNWSMSQYGFYLSFDYAVLGLTLFFLLPVLTSVFKMSDVNLLILSILTKIARLLCISVASDTWVVYLSSLFGCTGGILVSASKSLITKTIEEFEVGKTFSLLSCAETASNMIGAIVFSAVYRMTVDVYPGAAFILDAVLYGLALAVTMVYKRHSSQQELLQQYAEDHPLQSANPFRNGSLKGANGNDCGVPLAYESGGQLHYDASPNGVTGESGGGGGGYLPPGDLANDADADADADAESRNSNRNPFSDSRNIDK